MDFKSAEDKICDNLREAVENMADKISYTDYNNINKLREDNEKLNKLREKMRKACMYHLLPYKLSRRHSFGGKRRRIRQKRGKATKGRPRRRRRRKTRRKRGGGRRKRRKTRRHKRGGFLL